MISTLKPDSLHTSRRAGIENKWYDRWSLRKLCMMVSPCYIELGYTYFYYIDILSHIYICDPLSENLAHPAFNKN